MNLSILMISFPLKFNVLIKKKNYKLIQQLNLANKDMCYPNPMPACVGKKTDSGLIRLADFFPDPDRSF